MLLLSSFLVHTFVSSTRSWNHWIPKSHAKVWVYWFKPLKINPLRPELIKNCSQLQWKTPQFNPNRCFLLAIYNYVPVILYAAFISWLFGYTCSIGLHGPGIRSMLMTRVVTMAQRSGISCMSVELVAAIDRWLLLGRYRPKSDIEQPLTEGVN